MVVVVFLCVCWGPSPGPVNATELIILILCIESVRLHPTVGLPWSMSDVYPVCGEKWAMVSQLHANSGLYQTLG
jgi:hypothetical protein